MSKKILQILDSKGWAIDTLAKGIIRYNPQYHWQQIILHPKDLEQGKIDLEPVREAILWADVIDAGYWRTLSQLLDVIPELKQKPIVLTHQNEKNLLSYEWPDNIIHVVETKFSESVIKERYPNAKVHLIPVGYDHTVFKYQDKFPPKEKAVGYVGRIVPWKGLKEVAKACYELGYPLMLMGKHDKPSYYNEIPDAHKENIQWDFFNCEESDRPDFYKEITCYVGFSGSGRETGPLGLVEAMASGVPCITTHAGIAADIGEDNENMLMVDYDDYDGLKSALQRLMESDQLQSRLRKAGWDTIRGYNDERRAWQYREIFNNIFFKEDLVSVIIVSTSDRIEQNRDTLKSLDAQSYKGIEAVVVFDQAIKDSAVKNFKTECDTLVSFPVKVLETHRIGGYNLAMARNIAAIEADGEYLMFNDSRLCPDMEAVKEMVEVLKGKQKAWVFGEKGGEKSTFVENFSMIRRQEYINAGMSNERIDAYGGMSQELRGRFGRQGFEFGYVPTAKAVQMLKGSLSSTKKAGLIEMKNLLVKLKIS